METRTGLSKRESTDYEALKELARDFLGLAPDPSARGPGRYSSYRTTAVMGPALVARHNQRTAQALNRFEQNAGWYLSLVLQPPPL